MLEFIELKDDNSNHYKEVYFILKECGEDMYKNQLLEHWLNPYPLSKIKEDIISKRLFLVKLNQEFIGTFSLDKNSSKFFDDNKNYIYLSKFAILPNQSGRGIGSRCLNYIETIAKNENYKGIRLDVYDKSKHAINFYMRNGFKELFLAKTTNFSVICMEKRWS